MFKNKLKKISVCIILIFAFLVIMAPLSQVQAQSDTGIPPLTKAETFTGLIEGIIDAITPIAIAAAVIMIIYAGFLFMTAGGNDDKISIARKALIWSLVGLAVILIGSGLVDIIEEILGS